MKVLVIGAGVGGLAAALAIQQEMPQHTVEVCEKASKIGPVGAGIVVHPNGTRVLDKIGVGSELRSSALSRVGYRCVNTQGDEMATVMYGTDADDMTAKYGAPVLVLHRASLHQLLLDRLEPDTVKIQRKCIAVETNDNTGVTVKFEDGSRISADLVIAADGMRSTMRRLVIGDTARQLGFWNVRGLVELDDEESQHPFLSSAEGGGFLTTGEHLQLFAVPMGDNVVSWALSLPNNRYNRSQYKTNEAIKELLLREVAGWHDPVGLLIKRTDPSSFIVFDVVDRAPVSSFARNRIVFCGDAIHGSTPNMGQGASQTLEDVDALAHCLKQLPCQPTYKEIEDALSQYDSFRVQRSQEMYSWANEPSLLLNGWFGWLNNDSKTGLTTPEEQQQRMDKLFNEELGKYSSV